MSQPGAPSSLTVFDIGGLRFALLGKHPGLRRCPECVFEHAPQVTCDLAAAVPEYQSSLTITRVLAFRGHTDQERRRIVWEEDGADVAGVALAGFESAADEAIYFLIEAAF